MEVILLDNVDSLGKVGDTVKVSPGYGRNFLLPQGKAALATPENMKAIEARRAELEKAAAEELSKAKDRAKAFENLEVVDGSGNNLHIAPEDTTISNIVVRHVHIHDLRDGPGAAIKINRNNEQAAGVAYVYIEESDLSESRANAVIDGVGVSHAVVRDSWIHDNEPGSHGVF